MPDTYNGWTNYETWAVALHLDNEEGSATHWRLEAESTLEQSLSDYPDDIERARADATGTLAQHLSVYADLLSAAIGAPDLGHSVYADLLAAAIEAVDWHEIARHYIDDVSVYAAGWNMPGYMPDNAPAYFADAGLAVDYLKESAETHAEQDDIDPPEGDWAPDRDGAFGVTFNGLHYWVQEV